MDNVEFERRVAKLESQLERQNLSSRRTIFVTIVGACVGLPLASSAVGPVWTGLFTKNTSIRASEITDNFTILDQRLTAVEQAHSDTRLSTLETTVAQLETDVAGKQDANPNYSIGAMFCGSTPVKYSGQFAQNGKGYSAAKATCEALGGECGRGAHLCTYPELQQSAAVGITISAVDGYGWVSGSTYYDSNDATDCSGFTSNVSTGRGSLWRTGLNAATPDLGPDIGHCSDQWPLLCCD